MRIVKDEAAVLAACVEYAKYELVRSCNTKEESLERINALNNLQKKLRVYSDDYRRLNGRRRDSWSECMQRFVKRYTDKK